MRIPDCIKLSIVIESILQTLLTLYSVATRENAPPAAEKCDKGEVVPMCLKDLPERFFSFMYVRLVLGPSVSESSPKASDSKLSDKSGGLKTGLPPPRVLIG